MSVPMKLEKAKLVKMAGGGAGIGAAIGGAAASVGGIGGMLPVVWNDTEMNFRFNPPQMILNKTATYGGSNNRTSEEGGQEQYANTGTRTLSFNALLDEWEAPPGAGGDVGDMVTKLQNWCNPTPESIATEQPEPPTVMFVWGKFNFTGRLESVNATFDLFRRDGTAARAEVAVSMKERPTETSGTNPTSGGPPGRRSRVIVQGDSLQGLAYRELGDASLWRVIAEMNGIDDPMCVPNGTVVLVPSAADAGKARRIARGASR